MPELKTKQGRLTAYGLACGYVERYELGAWSVQLWHEGACFHVRVHNSYSGRVFWESDNSVGRMRKLYREAKRTIYKMSCSEYSEAELREDLLSLINYH